MNNIDHIGRGIHKQWIYSSKLKFELSCDYLQKINFSIADFKTVKECRSGMADVCFLIILVTWIVEACEQIEKAVRPEVIEEFAYNNEDEMKMVREYIMAMRSFVVAHPLSTNRHPKFSLDGDYICIDITTGPVEGALKAFNSYGKYYLSVKGLTRVNSIEPFDFRLFVYSKKEGAEFFDVFGCYIDDLEYVVNKYIEKLNTLDRFLARKKRKEYTC